MHRYDPSALGNRELLRELAALVAQGCLTAAALLAHLAEVDARRLYLPAGFPSMHAYCVGALRFSIAAAYKRIQAARTAREFPALLEAVADGRLHLTAVCMLAPHLTAKNAEELIAAAACRGQNDLVAWLADRFAPPPELLPLEASAQLGARAQLSPGRAGAPIAVPQREAQPDTPAELALRRVEVSQSTWPSAPPRSMLHVAITARTRVKLARAQALLGHEADSGDLERVVDRALDALIALLERREAGARQRKARVPQPGVARPAQPERTTRSARATRTVPARVKREVWQRDQAQCAYIGLDGLRCPARKHLEFDHLDPFARGGGATTDRMRLLCRAHNQFEAERVYGVEYMRAKRGRT